MGVQVGRWLWLAMLLFCLQVVPSLSQEGQHNERILVVDGQWRDTGAFSLSWQSKHALRSGVVDIHRRLLGEQGGSSWWPLAEGIRHRRVYVDETAKPGKAYEYRVVRTDGDDVQVGYWLAGRQVEATLERGVVFLVVDSTLEQSLAFQLDRFVDDLVGDGWRVVRRVVSRHEPKNAASNLTHASELRDWLSEEANKASDVTRALILVGHVPIVKTGQVRPDGHNPQPHESDLYYADLGQPWARNAEGELLQNRLPDLRIDMLVGRIDFAPISAGDRVVELAHLQHYFDKNHRWRHGQLGDLRNAYGQSGHLSVEIAMLNNIVGPEQVSDGGHHDKGVTQPYLWGVDFGHWKGSEYPGAGIKPVFAINFGSGKQHFGKHGNPMTQLLAQEGYTLTVGWGARPAWWLQRMALGGTIGDVHFATVNNGPWYFGDYQNAVDYYPMGNYLWRAPVWVNLLGDPTLHAFPLAPPVELSSEIAQGAAKLSWQSAATDDVLGYQVWRLDPEVGEFQSISGLLADNHFEDAAWRPGYRYMVRSYGLKQVYAGSFYTWSQGVFTTPLN